jgi:acetoin utilization protein AcuB
MDLEVKSYMSGSPISIEPDTSAIAALELMIEHAIRHLPVVTADGRVRGIVSFEDLRAALPVPISLINPLDAAARQSALDVCVSDAMTAAPVTIPANAPLQEAVSKMLQHRIGCLPIVDERGHLDGIVTQTDLLQALATVLWSEG